MALIYIQKEKAFRNFRLISQEFAIGILLINDWYKYLCRKLIKKAIHAPSSQSNLQIEKHRTTLVI